MRRFRGEALPDRPRLAIMVSDKVGNFVVASTLLRGLRERFPGCSIDYLTDGPRSDGFVRASPMVDRLKRAEDVADDAGPYDMGVSSDTDPVFAEAMARLAPRYVAGPCRGLPELDDRVGALWAEPDWNRPDLLDDFGDVLDTQYIGEVWCRLASVHTDFFRTEVPTADPGAGVPDVLLATGGTGTAKLWPAERWRALARWLRGEGLSVGLVGIARDLQTRYYGAAVADDDRLVREAGVADLRGRWGLPEVAGACRAARVVVTIDNAIGHVAAGVGAPAVIIWGGSPWRKWAPRAACARNMLPDDERAGTAGVALDQVQAAVRQALG